MLTALNSAITLDIIFQQCYDFNNLDPARNKNGCFDCFQGIYAGKNYEPRLDELSAVIRKYWPDMDKSVFTEALANFKKQSGAQAFDDQAIAEEVSKYFTRVLTFKQEGTITSKKDWSASTLGTPGVNGKLVKLIASTDLSDQGSGRTGGSKWTMRVVRDGKLKYEWDFIVNNPEHKTQYLRDIVRTDGMPVELLATDIVQVGVFTIYFAHVATVTNTRFELHLEL